MLKTEGGWMPLTYIYIVYSCYDYRTKHAHTPAHRHRDRPYYCLCFFFFRARGKETLKGERIQNKRKRNIHTHDLVLAPRETPPGILH